MLSVASLFGRIAQVRSDRQRRSSIARSHGVSAPSTARISNGCTAPACVAVARTWLAATFQRADKRASVGDATGRAGRVSADGAFGKWGYRSSHRPSRSCPDVSGPDAGG